MGGGRRERVEGWWEGGRDSGRREGGRNYEEGIDYHTTKLFKRMLE